MRTAERTDTRRVREGSRGRATGVLAVAVVVVAGLAADAGRLRAQAGAETEVPELIRSGIEGPATEAGIVVVAGDRLYATEELPRFYEGRGFRPAWSDGGEPRPAADSLARAIALSLREGLEPDDYHLGPIRLALADVRRARRGGAAPDPQRLADLDLLLTDAFLTYGSHLLNGRVDPLTIHPDWTAKRTEEDLVALLDASLEEARIGGVLESLLPRHPGYARLREALERHRRVHESGGWAVVPGRTLRPGTRDSAVATLRERLVASGDLASADAPIEPELYDLAVADAVARFQARHGVEADGVVTLETNGLLNVPVEHRLREIELNLERWRWLPRDLGERHVVVNIAGFQVMVVDGDSTVFTSRVMVGQRYRATPVFSDEMTYLVLNPSWTIPPNILEVDKLPLIREDPGYLRENRIRVLAADGREIDASGIDWSAVTGTTGYRLRMDPGPENPLGRVKFMFPNQHFVYLHDTPDRELFDLNDRAFSSGCIRVERPLELAEVLLKETGWDAARIQRALQNPGEQTLPLPQSVPIHLLYWTVWVERDGRVQFRPDIYERDAALHRALRLPPPIAAADRSVRTGARD